MEGTWEVHGRCVEGVLEVDNSLRTLNVHHCLSLVTIGCPSNH